MINVANRKGTNMSAQKMLFRVIDTRVGEGSIYDYVLSKTISLGPVMVGTVAKANCRSWLEVEVVNENNCRKKRGAPLDKNKQLDHEALQRKQKADIIGISCSIVNSAPRGIELIKIYQGMPAELRPKAIIVGGWHATDSPVEFLSAGANAVVHGEAEEVLPSLLEAIRDGRELAGFAGVSYRVGDDIRLSECRELHIAEGTTEGKPELKFNQAAMDRLPHPDFRLVRFAKIKVYPAWGVRGCSGNCSFCRVCSLPARWPSVERRVDQIIWIATAFGARKIFVVDDHPEEDLESYRGWLRELAKYRRRRRIRLGLMTQNRVSLAEHPEVLREMREAGVHTSARGIESAIPEKLRAMRKPWNPKKLKEWAKVWRKSGIYTHDMFIVAFPMDEEERQLVGDDFVITPKQELKAMWKLVRILRSDTVQPLVLTPLLNTKVRRQLERQGRILPYGWERYTGFEVLFVPDKGVTAEDIQKEITKFSRKFYAFHLIWPFKVLSLLVHLAKIGLVTCAMPIFWAHTLKPWQPGTLWHRLWRKSLLHFGAFTIVMKVLRMWRKRQKSENAKP